MLPRSNAAAGGAWESRRRQSERSEGATCPAPGTGRVGVCPLFQFVSVLQSPLLSFIQNAGTRLSFRNSTPPLATSPSRLLPPLLKLCKRSPLPYCQNVQGCPSGYGLATVKFGFHFP